MRELYQATQPGKHFFGRANCVFEAPILGRHPPTNRRLQGLDARLVVPGATINHDNTRLIVTAAENAHTSEQAFWLLQRPGCVREVILNGDTVYLEQTSGYRMQSDGTPAIASSHLALVFASQQFNGAENFLLEVPNAQHGAPLRRGVAFRLKSVRTGRWLRMNPDVTFRQPISGHKEVVTAPHVGDASELWVLEEGVYFGAAAPESSD
eukprot:c10411_g1_i2.p1 GENE.c10411_g1_i2~~c10411_g1_i2.p1  ORF type:complete len:209 (-),score=32.67 c10411_g1_i2:17-643(-)